MKGTVKFFDETKRFGFIAGDDGKEYFVHQTGVEEGVNLQENDAVEFDVEEGDRGPKAVHVKKGSAEEAEPEAKEEAEPEAEEEAEPKAEEEAEPEAKEETPAEK